MLNEPELPSRAWLIVALLWVVGLLNYLDRVMITTMRGSIMEAIPIDLTPDFRAAIGVSLGQSKDPDHERQKTHDGG